MRVSLLRGKGMTGRRHDEQDRELKKLPPTLHRYFKGILEVIPDIPRKELCDMVDDHSYHQTNDRKKKEAYAIVETTCF
jgi:hypothetical protein